MVHKNFKHGQRRTTEYYSWVNMKNRCSSPTAPQYADYGGRGITVCERWQKFNNFLEDMGEKPEGMTLDRTDNNKGYSKDNCRWSTRSEQNRNTRANRRFTINGVTKLACEWTEEKGIDHRTFYNRIRLGWSPDDALNRPVNRGIKYKSLAAHQELYGK